MRGLRKFLKQCLPKCNENDFGILPKILFALSRFFRIVTCWNFFRTTLLNRPERSAYGAVEAAVAVTAGGVKLRTLRYWNDNDVRLAPNAITYYRGRDRIEGGDLGLCLFFEEIMEKCVFFTRFFGTFLKNWPLKTPFSGRSRGVSGKFFHESKIFPKIDFYWNFSATFSKIYQNLTKVNQT